MATAAIENVKHDAPTLEELAALLQQLVNRASYAETDVLTIPELCAALKISRSQLYKAVPKLRVSYLLGSQCPRVIWGDVLDALRQSATT